MKVILWGVVMIAGMCLGLATVRAAEPAPAMATPVVDLPEGYVNVMEYIRKVGKPDHTEAIRMALKATAKEELPTGPTTRHFPVYFPPGNYTISDTIAIDYGNIVGNNATITQTNPEKDIFSATNCAYMVSIKGITFSGGRDQIHIETPAAAAGILWRITDCNFRNANGRAMVLIGNMVYGVVERGYIGGCKGGIMYAECDGVAIRGFHGEDDGKTTAAAFDFRCGMITMEDCLWTPGSSNPDARWIDNRCAMLFIHHTHFGGEGGGYTPVVNYAKPAGTVINLDSCCFWAQGNAGKKVIVYCEEVPEVIDIKDCQVGGIEAILVNPKLDLKNYFVQSTFPIRPSYRVESCAGVIGGVPAVLKHPVVRTKKNAFLDDRKTAKLMAAAVKTVIVLPAEDGKPEECIVTNGSSRRIEPTDPSRYVKASFANCVMSGNADGEINPNANYFAMKPAGENLIIMKRQLSTGNSWVFLKGFQVDFDKYPIISRKIKSQSYQIKSDNPPVRVIDRETGKMAQFGGDTRYAAINLKQAFGGGVHTLDFRLYWNSAFLLGFWDAAEKAKHQDYETIVKECPDGNLPIGSYLVYDYIRAEAE